MSKRSTRLEPKRIRTPKNMKWVLDLSAPVLTFHSANGALIKVNLYD